MSHLTLPRRSFLAAILGGAGAMSGGALAVIGGAARAQTAPYRTCRTDADATDLPEYGTLSGDTDIDAEDLPGRGFRPLCESATMYSGRTDSDSFDAAGYGRGRSYTGFTDSDPTDAAGYGRGAGLADSDPTDAPGYGRGGGAPSPSPNSGVTDSDPDDAAGYGRGSAPPPAVAQFPVFPWPPPRASAQVVLDRNRYFSFPGVAEPTLGQVADRLTTALDARGYAERSFYQVAVDRVLTGFAVVSRLERFTQDGESATGSDRFVPPGGQTNFSLTDYISGLFFAPRGNYRLIVFLVTGEVFVTRGELTEESAVNLLEGGANTILSRIRAMPFKDGMQVTAMIYEYERGLGDDAVSQRLPVGQLDAFSHLRGSRLIVGRRLAS